jgi:hypothetical protein
MIKYYIHIPLAPILIWIELKTGWTWIIDYFVLGSMVLYLTGYLIGRYAKWEMK